MSPEAKIFRIYSPYVIINETNEDFSYIGENNIAGFHIQHAFPKIQS